MGVYFWLLFFVKTSSPSRFLIFKIIYFKIDNKIFSDYLLLTVYLERKKNMFNGKIEHTKPDKFFFEAHLIRIGCIRQSSSLKSYKSEDSQIRNLTLQKFFPS